MYNLPVKQLNEYKIGVVYVYGSAVNGCMTELSDIDIGIVFTDIEMIKDSLKAYSELNKVFFKAIEVEQEIDLVFLQRTSLTLQYNVISKGKVVYEVSPEFRAKYEERVLNEYLDFSPVITYFNKVALEAFR